MNEWDSWLKVQNLPLQRHLQNAMPRAVTGKFISNAARHHYSDQLWRSRFIALAAGFPLSRSCIFHLGQKASLCSRLFVYKATSWKRHRALTLNQQRKGVNWPVKDFTQIQQQRAELPMITLTWQTRKCKVHALHHIHILKKRIPPVAYIYPPLVELTYLMYLLARQVTII